MTDRLVNAETLAAALLNADTMYPYTEENEVHMDAAAILAAIPPDPRLAALLAAIDQHGVCTCKYYPGYPRGERHAPECDNDPDLRDALAAFEEQR